MRHVMMIAAVFALLLAAGINYSNAQQADADTSEMMQPAEQTCSETMQADPMSCCGGMGMMASEGMMGHMPEMGHMRMMEHRGMMPWDVMEARRHVMRSLMKLGLDEKQKTAVHGIIDRTAKYMIKKRSDLLVAEIELEDIIHNDPVDMNAAEAKLKQIESMKTETALAHIKAYEEVKALLTPQQKHKWKEMMEMHKMGGMEEGCKCGMMKEKKMHHKKPHTGEKKTSE